MERQPLNNPVEIRVEEIPREEIIQTDEVEANDDCFRLNLPSVSKQSKLRLNHAKSWIFNFFLPAFDEGSDLVGAIKHFV